MSLSEFINLYYKYQSQSLKIIMIYRTLDIKLDISDF